MPEARSWAVRGVARTRGSSLLALGWYVKCKKSTDKSRGFPGEQLKSQNAAKKWGRESRVSWDKPPTARVARVWGAEPRRAGAQVTGGETESRRVGTSRPRAMGASEPEPGCRHMLPPVPAVGGDPGGDALGPPPAGAAPLLLRTWAPRKASHRAPSGYRPLDP